MGHFSGSTCFLVTFTNEPEARRADFWLEIGTSAIDTVDEHFETLRQTPWEEYLDIAEEPQWMSRTSFLQTSNG